MPRRPHALLGALVVLLVGAVAAAPAQARNVRIRSFDGTKLAAHFFPAAKRVHGKAPTVLVMPNWSQPAATSLRQGTSAVSGVVGIGDAPQGRVQRPDVGLARLLQVGRHRVVRLQSP